MSWSRSSRGEAQFGVRENPIKCSLTWIACRNTEIKSQIVLATQVQITTPSTGREAPTKIILTSQTVGPDAVCPVNKRYV